MDTKKAVDLLEDIQWGEGTVFLVNRDLAEAAELAIEALEKTNHEGVKTEEILTGVQLAEIACMQIRYKKMQELLEQAAECIEDCYGRETDLSEAIRKELS